MSRTIDILLTDLRSLTADLGRSGGQTSPSIYDTAQVLRLAPPPEGVWPALTWLLEQQQPDGGWGNPAVPHARDLPTLAAVLALQNYSIRRETREAMQEGLAFLRRQAGQWSEVLPEDLPVGVELLLPSMLKAATQAGLDVSPELYTALISLSERRRKLIAHTQPGAGTPAVHSWEAWGTDPDPALLDGSGGVGHSPAATAAWLNLAQGQSHRGDAVVAARYYLAGAAASTGLDVPGVVPNAWPITRTEQATALYAFLVAGMLDEPILRDAVQPVLTELHAALSPAGLGTSDYFAPDGDDTAMALACLAGRRSVSSDSLQHFAVETHFCTYRDELQTSIATTAHAVHALALLGEPASPASDYLSRRQRPDGRWQSDKWNSSWIYTTCHVLVALKDGGDFNAAGALSSLLAYQGSDGGWGLRGSNSEETAYAVTALLHLRSIGLLSTAVQRALQRATTFLKRRYRPLVEEEHAIWLAKEPYRPRRIARAFELSALLRLMLEEDRS